MDSFEELFPPILMETIVNIKFSIPCSIFTPCPCPVNIKRVRCYTLFGFHRVHNSIRAIHKSSK